MNDNKIARINARLTKEEHESFVNRFKESVETSYSDYIRRCVFSDELSKSAALIKEVKGTNYQIRKIGVLVNQIAHKVNAGYIYTHADSVAITESFLEIQKMFKELKEQIGGD